jgi:hypothetical protein
MDVKETASRILGRKADIMTRRSLHRVLRDRIEASALQVFRMTQRSPVARLTDIIEAIELIQRGMACVGRYR